MFESSIEAYTLAKNRLKSQNLKIARKAKASKSKLFDLKKLLQNAFSKYK
ncbi:MAG: hypothetical protein KR126chlam4_00683 [Candidatus Anoxychlamydiales bacterium]|uniref:Uncharacterized protein n=1 Tax=marine sediment metagenome TaxID=412755 RepID=A0A0F9CW45_9ZZZZ|nr:hypothetical protein [Candidatus Anoxychlamydiales bacterium]NGX40852.1 hypothetical protein [Candidatus Anoxychlamydiales bacterium]